MTTSSTLEQGVIYEAGQPTEVQQILDEVRGLTPAVQLRTFLSQSPYANNRLPRDMTAGDVAELVEFAAGEDSSPSLAVRTQALDCALRRLTSLWHPVDDPDHLREEMARIVPMPAFAAVAEGAQLPDTYDPLYRQAMAQRGIAKSLLRHDGLDEEVLFPDWHEYSFDPIDMMDDNPASALLFLTYLTKENTGRAGRFAALLPLAESIREVCGPAYEKLDQPAVYDSLMRRALDRYVDFGADHGAELQQLVDAGKSSHESRPYAQTLHELYEASFWLTKSFPAEYANGVSQGVRELVANSMYAINQHLKNGKTTQVKLPLNDQLDVLGLTLEGDEPLELLQALKTAVETIGAVATDPYVPAVKVVRGDEYQVVRLFGDREATVYIRPRGSHTYDPELEYGRPGEGVEASVSYVTDVRDRSDGLLEIGRHRQPGPDSRLSIRLDREGVAPEDHGKPGIARDPTRKRGTLSLDVGSVLGDDDWLSTKIGRFLAWGNVLRSRAVGSNTELNHVRHYFTEEDGDADTFAGIAADLSDMLTERSMNTHQIAAHFSGRIAFSATSGR